MAGSYSLTGTLVPAAANTANQILWGVVSGATVGDGTLYLADVTFDSDSLGSGVLIQLFRATGGIPTATSFTVTKESSDAQTTSGLSSFWVTSGSSPVTASPTGLTVIRNWYVSPASGMLTQWSLSREVYLPAGSTYWTGLRITTPSGVAPDVAYNAAWAE